MTENHFSRMSSTLGLLHKSVGGLHKVIRNLQSVHGNIPLVQTLKHEVLHPIIEAKRMLTNEAIQEYNEKADQSNDQEDESIDEDFEEIADEEETKVELVSNLFKGLNLSELVDLAEEERRKEEEESNEEIHPEYSKHPFPRLIKVTEKGTDKRFYFRYRRRYLKIKECIDRIDKLQPSLKLKEIEKIIEVKRDHRSELLQDALNFQAEIHKLLPSEDPDIQELVKRTDELVSIAQEAVQVLGE